MTISGRMAAKLANMRPTIIPKWRTGRVQMSGMVAERLFNLLPPRMPLGVKYKLVEGLCTMLARVPNIGSELEPTQM